MLCNFLSCTFTLDLVIFAEKYFNACGVLSDETAAQGKLLEEIDKLKDRKTAIKEEAKADEARYQKMLDLEKAGYLRLDELKVILTLL